jgi:hypothetical protein
VLLQKTEVSAEVVKEKTKVDNLNATLGRLTEQRNGIQIDMKIREETITRLDEQTASINELCEERKTERSELATKITEQKQDLRKLKDDINMFPTEISGFVSQAAHNTKMYWKLAWLPILLLVAMTALLVSNAANLTTILDENNNTRLFSILVTRIPYVVIISAVLGVAYKLAALLIGEIMRINQQRLNLSKVSIIAADVSKASLEGLTDLSDVEIIELRNRIKMDLLRDHFGEYLSKDFSPSHKETTIGADEPNKLDPADNQDELDLEEGEPE